MISIRNVVISLFLIVLLSSFAYAEDLSGYRGFHFGMSLPEVLKETEMEPSEVKIIHDRPEMIQELNLWPPFSTSSTSQVDSVLNTRFSFYNGDLFRIVVNYKRDRTAGLTEEDMIEAISATYGTASKAAAGTTFSLYGVNIDTQMVIARWEDSEYSFSLFRSSYQPSFGMIAYSKLLDALSRTASEEAIRLDRQEAPQREIERKKLQEEEDRVAQEDARAVNKPTFRF